MTGISNSSLVNKNGNSDRARRARDLEVGDTDNSDGIRSFLKAMRPTEEELDSLFTEQEGGDDAEETEEAGNV